MPNYISTLTGQEIENSLLASKAATAINGIVKYDGTEGGTLSVSAAVRGTDFDVPPILQLTDPTTSTVGVVGQFCVNTSTNTLYICTGIASQVYTWQSVGGGAGGFIVKGMYATLAELQAAVPNPSVGDAYAVGTSESNEIYIWNGTVWKNIGTLRGETGADGEDGEDGEDGVSPTVTITTITGGHRITITDAEHPSGQSFDVMDGTGAVASVNGQTGTVVLDGADINVDDTASTPVSIKDTISQQSSQIEQLTSGKENKGKMTISNVEKTVSTQNLVITDGGVTTTYAVLVVS